MGDGQAAPEPAAAEAAAAAEEAAALQSKNWEVPRDADLGKCNARPAYKPALGCAQPPPSWPQKQHYYAEKVWVKSHCAAHLQTSTGMRSAAAIMATAALPTRDSTVPLDSTAPAPRNTCGWLKYCVIGFKGAWGEMFVRGWKPQTATSFPSYFICCKQFSLQQRLYSIMLLLLT